MAMLRKIKNIFLALRAFWRSLRGNTPRQLRTVAAGWFLCGVLFTLGSFASIPNALVFIFFVLTPLKEGSNWHPSQGQVAAVATFVVIMLIIHVVLARVCFYACQSISTRKNYGYVLWAGKMARLVFPVGTLLGWATLRVLGKEEVRREFEGTMAGGSRKDLRVLSPLSDQSGG